MAENQNPRMPTVQGPAIYRIRVRGRLDASWSDRVGGNHLKEAMAEVQSASKETETTLRSKLSAAKAKVAETKADAEAANAQR